MLLLPALCFRVYDLWQSKLHCLSKPLHVPCPAVVVLSVPASSPPPPMCCAPPPPVCVVSPPPPVTPTTGVIPPPHVCVCRASQSHLHDLEEAHIRVPHRHLTISSNDINIKQPLGQLRGGGVTGKKRPAGGGEGGQRVSLRYQLTRVAGSGLAVTLSLQHECTTSSDVATHG